MFLPHKTAEGKVIPWEYLPCTAITPKIGMTLIYNSSSGQLEICDTSDTGVTPTYIAMADYSAAVTANDRIPVIRVDDETIYETTNSASFSSAKRGTKVTITSGGLSVTATTSNGVAEIVDFDDVAAAGTGGKVWVRFK